MSPAVSQPAVPPPTMTTALTACTILELGAYPHRVGAPKVHDVQRLVLEAPVSMVNAVREIQRLEICAQMAAEVVGGAEVQVGRGRQIYRFVAESSTALLLTQREQLASLPLQREPSLQSVRLVEGYEVRRVTDTRQRELVAGIDRGVEIPVAVRVSPVDLQPEAIHQHLLPGCLDSGHVGREAVYDGALLEDRLLTGGVR